MPKKTKKLILVSFCFNILIIQHHLGGILTLHVTVSIFDTHIYVVVPIFVYLQLLENNTSILC